MHTLRNKRILLFLLLAAVTVGHLFAQQQQAGTPASSRATPSADNNSDRDFAKSQPRDTENTAAPEDVSDPNTVDTENSSQPAPLEKVSTDKTDIEELIIESEQTVDQEVLRKHEEVAKDKKAAKPEEAETGKEKTSSTEPKPTLPETKPPAEESVTQDSTDVEELIEEADITPRQRFEDEYVQKALIPYSAFKKRLHDKYRISLATEQILIYQHATGGRNPNEQSLYNLSIFGLWDLSGDGQADRGTVGFLFEQRNNINGLSVENFSQEVGSTFRTHTLQTEDNSRTALRQLWWRKKFDDDQYTLTVGKLHHSSYYNRNAYAGSSKTHFLSAPFSENPNRLIPKDGLGANLTVKPNDSYYLSLGFGDARSNLTSSGFDTIQQSDVVTMGEIGLTPEKANYRFTLWHNDETVIDDVTHEAGSGFAFSFDREVNQKIGIFGRYGYTESQVDKMTNFVSGGFVVQDAWGIPGDLFGCGVSWDENSEANRDEFSFEVFHRMQATKMLQLTPSLLVVFEPTRSDKTEPVAVLGLRARVLF